MADFIVTASKHRHLFSVTALQLRVAVDIHDFKLEIKIRLHPVQSGDHFLA